MIDPEMEALAQSATEASEAKLDADLARIERDHRDLELLAKVRAHPACATLIDALEDELASFESDIPEYGEELRLALSLLSGEESSGG